MTGSPPAWLDRAVSAAGVGERLSNMIPFLSVGLLSLPTTRLEGQNVLLRPPVVADWEGWSDLRGVSRHFLTPWEPAWPADTLTRTAFVRRVRRHANDWHDDLAYNFLSFDRVSRALVGGLSLGNLRRGVAQTATIGYWVGEPYARRGYTSEAVRLALGYAFDTLTLHRVEASCLPDNVASRSLLTKLGFTCEGLARGYLRINGSWRDHLVYAILKDDPRG
jgi:ribosomal-protein-alanine N-acetyltransferase